MSERRAFATQEEFDSFRAEVHAPYRWTFGDWTFDWIDKCAGGVHLDQRCADVLLVLCQSLTYPLSAGQIAERVSKLNGGASFPSDNVRVYIRRLRNAIGSQRIWNYRQSGYLFVPFPGDDLVTEEGE